jgi:predicted ATPase
VARLTRQLDGIPLAIELAVSRLTILSLDQLEAGLNQRLRLLAGGHRTAPNRQKTLRATIDWSYELLSDEEKVILRRLAVFGGGCTLEAAEVISVDLGRDQPELMDLICPSNIRVSCGGQIDHPSQSMAVQHRCGRPS